MMKIVQQMKQNKILSISRMNKIENFVLNAMKWCFDMKIVITWREWYLLLLVMQVKIDQITVVNAVSSSATNVM